MSPRDRDDFGAEHFDAEDLVARARQGSLSRAEQEALTAALAQSPELRTAYQVGIELDRATAVQAGDDALLARAADAAITRASELTSRTTAAHSVRTIAVAAAIVLTLISATGIATALWTGAMPWPFAKKASAPSDEPAIEVQRATPKPVKVARPAPAPSSLEAQAIPEPAAIPEATPHARKASSVPDAAELFRDANAARRAGDLGRARRLYAALIEQHGSSDEAGLARVSLGKLLLASGDARAAEREFRRYLGAGGGQLEEEALVGQAQSLGRLQRSDEERHAWQRLLAAHPSSVYAAQAQQRIAALEATAD
jgi:TolA-binding protein